eukprot:CAMPEP_0114136534 /NCGR_PEP_ID=MMETSP0043_2-20121206/15279_1 /TAXON_ID=464988 /ORGANISM="Hemiselmis andersenii, Strain CCMP644" /LENGTH=583 /DNA_ID=CAMNT_0001230321 /DNA_START=42 /DNA_END=1791 /DNA_ORIENTATION=-
MYRRSYDESMEFSRTASTTYSDYSELSPEDYERLKDTSLGTVFARPLPTLPSVSTMGIELTIGDVVDDVLRAIVSEASKRAGGVFPTPEGSVTSTSRRRSTTDAQISNEYAKARAVWASAAALGDTEAGREFLAAVREGELSVVKKLIFQDPGLTGAVDRDDRMRGALHIACAEGSGGEQMVRFLLRQTVQSRIPPSKDTSLREPLHEAAASGDLRTALALIDHKHFTPDDGTLKALPLSTSHASSPGRGGAIGEESILALTLIKAGFRLDMRTAGAVYIPPVLPGGQSFNFGAKETCLHVAARGLVLSTLKMLLERGADLSKLSAGGCTALHVSLIPRDANGSTWEALGDFAGGGGGKKDSKLSQVLLRVPSGSIEHLHEGRGLAIVRALVSEGVGVDTKDNEGRTALMLACSLRLEDISQYLLTEGADASARDLRGRTVLMYASVGRSANCVSCIRRASPDSINLVDNLGNTALHYAAEVGDLDCVNSLIMTGITKINIQNAEGKTPRDLATRDIINFRLELAAGSETEGGDPPTVIQRVWRGHRARLEYRRYIDRLAHQRFSSSALASTLPPSRSLKTKQ